MEATCYRHPEVEAVAKCHNCGRPICPPCMSYREGTVFCGRACADRSHAEGEEVHGSGTRFRLRTPAGGRSITLTQPGLHLVEDALCAAACAWASERLGKDALQAMASGLEQFRGVSARLSLREAPGGLIILDDSYNANPASVEYALKTLADHAGRGRAFAVLADMLELGPEAEQKHNETGHRVGAHSIEGLITLGPLSAHTAAGARAAGVSQVEEATDTLDAAVRVRAMAERGDIVLVKGSRAMQTERVVAALMEPR